MTDDYSGFGYCSPRLLTHPYHGQTRCDGPINYGRTNLYRYTQLDRTPFTALFRFDMEIMDWKDCLVSMEVIAYWYAMPGFTHGCPPITAAGPDLRPSTPFQPFHAPGAIEAERMSVLHAAGTTDVQTARGTVGDGRYLCRMPGKPGDGVALAFDVPQSGDYRIIGHFLKGIGFGTIVMSFNGAGRTDPIDLSKDAFYPDPSGEMDLGVVHLNAGSNRRDITCTHGSPRWGLRRSWVWITSSPYSSHDSCQYNFCRGA